MHTGNDRVRGNNKMSSRAAIEDGSVIEQAKPAGSGERREEAPNAFELAEECSGNAARHGY
jgi:hypothetical protein